MSTRIAVVGGGAAGFFAAITAARAGSSVTLLEKSGEFLTKVRISGGGRCNVTHSCFDPKELSKRYPRGGKALIGAFHRFQPTQTIAWFEACGVALKTESDGRMFPTTDSSATILQCLITQAEAAGVKLRSRCGVERVTKTPSGTFDLTLSNEETLQVDRLLLATGGTRSAALSALSASLGHTLLEPVPSLFTFTIENRWLHALAGLAVNATVHAPTLRLRETGPVLFTHWGLSGPAILRLSAWGACSMHEVNYRFPLEIAWISGMNSEQFRAWCQEQRKKRPGKTIINSPMEGLPSRLWESLVREAGIADETRWAILKKEEAETLGKLVLQTRLEVVGKSLNKEEFVTCGGIPLSEVNFKTMESRICPGLYFAGEILDVDGITGGFNFQAAWTTGWIAGQSMAGVEATEN